MELTQAKEIAGTLTNTSKMPGFSYGIPAKYCKKGSELRQIEGSPCYGCYAFKGFYPMPNVRNAMQKRFDGLTHPDWVKAMVTLINKQVKPEVPFFRWHDSGDIQNEEHFSKIIEVAIRLPHIHFWLPTQEHDLVRKFAWPKNLNVRLSNRRNGEHIETTDLPSSGVAKMEKAPWEEVVNNNTKEYFTCPSSLQENQCKTCRACWNPKVKHIIYRAH